MLWIVFFIIMLPGCAEIDRGKDIRCYEASQGMAALADKAAARTDAQLRNEF
jgi:hypothetical protein